ncbi:MAG: DUF3488 and DUF4129 domain-containing transglutaminase family protein [Lysobacterales bacterium]
MNALLAITPAARHASEPGRPDQAPFNVLGLNALILLLVAVLISNAGWLPLPLLAGLAALLGLKWLWQRYLRRPIPAWIRLPVFVLTLILVVFSSGSPLSRDGGVALLIALAVLKLLESNSIRDARILVAALLFLCMTTFLFDQSMGITVLVGLSTVLAFAVLALLDPLAPASNVAQGWRGLLLAGRHSGRIALAALPLATVVFLFFPRLAEPLWGAPWTSNQGKTGISDVLRPGMLSRLWPDDSPSFRVSFDGAIPAPRDLYWRGPVLLRFDGLAWRRADWERIGTPYPLEYRQDQVFGYEVLLEPTDQRWLFPLDLPIDGPDDAFLRFDGQLVSRRPVIAPKRYRLRSATRATLEATLLPGHRDAATWLPRDSNPRTRALVHGWRERGMDDAALIAAALDMFHQSFGYSLEPPPLAPERSIDEFLFETQSGYCEHFASAFAFMMRAADIPARVVTGYLGGVLNRSGNYWTVRHSDAHAWTEIWQPGRGWIRVDPTSAVAPERIDRGNNEGAIPAANRWYSDGWAARWHDRFDVVARWWRSRVVDFGALQQRSLLAPFGIPDSDLRELMIALIVSAGLALAFGLWWSMRDFQRGRGQPLLAAWQRFGQRLERAGVKRELHEDPLVFARRAALALPRDASRIRQLAQAFARSRYARTFADQAERELIDDLRRFRPNR